MATDDALAQATATIEDMKKIHTTYEAAMPRMAILAGIPAALLTAAIAILTAYFAFKGFEVGNAGIKVFWAILVALVAITGIAAGIYVTKSIKQALSSATPQKEGK